MNFTLRWFELVYLITLIPFIVNTLKDLTISRKCYENNMYCTLGEIEHMDKHTFSLTYKGFLYNTLYLLPFFVISAIIVNTPLSMVLSFILVIDKINAIYLYIKKTFYSKKTLYYNNKIIGLLSLFFIGYIIFNIFL